MRRTTARNPTHARRAEGEPCGHGASARGGHIRSRSVRELHTLQRMQTRERSVKRKPYLLLGLTGALAVTGVVGGALASRGTQDNVMKQFDLGTKALTESGLATVKTLPYEKTLFGGTQRTIITFRLPDVSLTKAGTTKPFTVTLVSRVRNGPFPGLRSFGAASIDTDVVFEPTIQKEVDGALGGKKILLHTDVAFGGNTTTTLNVPAGSYAATDGNGGVNWAALTYITKMTPEQARSTLTWAGLTMKDPSGSRDVMKVENVRATSMQRLDDDGLSDSDARLTVGGVTLHGKSAGRVDGLTVTSSNRTAQGTVDFTASYSAKKVTLGAKTVLKPTVALSLRNLDRVALRVIMQYLRDIDADGGADASNASTSAGTTSRRVSQAALDQAVQQLVSGNPQVGIDSASVSTGAGDVVIRAKAGLSGVNTAELPAMLRQRPELLMQHVRVSAHGEASEAALAELARTLGDNDPRAASGVEEAVSSFEKMGYVKRVGTVLSTDVTYSAQGLLVNGQPFEY